MTTPTPEQRFRYHVINKIVLAWCQTSGLAPLEPIIERVAPEATAIEKRFARDEICLVFGLRCDAGAFSHCRAEGRSPPVPASVLIAHADYLAAQDRAAADPANPAMPGR